MDSSALPSHPQPPAQSARRPVCRRRFLGLLAAAGAGAIFVRRPEWAVEWWEQGAEWLQDQGRELGEALAVQVASPDRVARSPLRTAYAAFLAGQGFKHIPIPTVLAPHYNRHGSVQNSLPPQKLWKNILPTLAVADRLAGELKETLRVHSAYRSPEYNATCPGAARWSQHLRNNALDIRFSSPPKVVARVARQLRDRGVFRGGIGLYAGFVHIDTRGYNADW